MDHEIGRLLVSTGLAQRASDSDGGLIYTPEATNTMIVMVGDNGTYFASVKPPYTRADPRARLIRLAFRHRSSWPARW